MNYLSAKEIASSYCFCMSTVWGLIKEIRDQQASGRYDEDAILDGCGTRLREDVLVDYLKFRKQLKQAPQYVPPPQIETPMAEIIEDYSKRKEMRH